MFSHSLVVSSRDFAGEHLHRATYSGRGSFKSAGFVEWVMAFVFTFYFWAFVDLLASEEFDYAFQGRLLTVVKCAE